MEIQNDVAKKPKRLTSVVWNHFERVRKADVCYAVCVHCNKKLSGSSNSGTTHLRNHLMRCLKRSNFDVSQLLAAKRRKKDSTVTLTNITYDEGQRKDDYIKPAIIKFDQDPKKEEILSFGSSKFDQERSRSDLARMIILHGYSPAMVDHVGFQVFVKNLQPLFEVVPNNDIQYCCMEMYQKERQKVFEMMNKFPGRINFSVEMWTSRENAAYVCLIAHYIDEGWKLHKKITNFVMLDSSHTEDLLSEVIIKCVTEWNIDGKLFALTFDDCSIEDDIVVKIKDRISEKRPVLGRQLFDIRSALHVLNSIAQDSIETMQEVIEKIRGSINHVKSSQVTLGKFNEIVQQAGLSSHRKLVIDCPTQWNSTFLMVETATELRAVFSLLQDHDPSYISSLTETEWEWAASISGYLHLFSEITTIISSNKSPTANIYFPELCDVHIQMIEWCKNTDDFISSMAVKMKAKFDKYWNKCSLSLAMAVVLDPRFKMKLVEYYYSQIYGSYALNRIKEVSDGIKELYNAYSICSTVVDEEPVLPRNTTLPSFSNESRDRLKGFDKFLNETSQSQGSESDLDKYLEEPVFPRNGDFNLLNWWKVHTPRYPILSMMARDLLGTPMSTSPPELGFGNNGRVLEQSRSSLSPETLEALICTQDWLRTEPLDPTPLAIHAAQPLLVEST